MVQAVNIHLPNLDEILGRKGEEWVHLLSIPSEDIRRLTFRPLKWLRFVTFTVCGAKGNLFTSPGGDVVDYEHITLENIAESYYYFPDGERRFHDLAIWGERNHTSCKT
jgi:hypothetical protein